MKNRERFLNTINFNKSDDRLPMVEWAPWWDKTIDRWRKEGLDYDLSWSEIGEYFKLDTLRQFWISAIGLGYPQCDNGCGPISDMNSYRSIKKYLYPTNSIEQIRNQLLELKALHDNGDIVVWMTLDGFFWFPRMLFGIEKHLYSFYDEPELLHEINEDLSTWHIMIIEEFCKILKPDFMTFAEDMSYNHGPMLSKESFDEFLKPYYNKVIPVLKKHNIIPLIDTDGQVEPMIPWLIEVGIEGVLPLERQSGVDINRIRDRYPSFKMIGGFNKLVMHLGEEEIRREFERILPAMKSGGYIPSVDHQTPPAVSLENYNTYLKVLKEYCEKVCL